ncbi:MAG: mevalonate kinase [Armatimonadota bacterium]|jgi:glucuronokinase
MTTAMAQAWVGSRVGLVGNPSDGFGGKTIACLIKNYGAQVTVRESQTLEIVRHPIYDPLSFRSLSHLADIAENDGYYGGIRLLYATCKRFHDICRERGIELGDRSFALQYDTNIPRQVGLGGSSAIITAAVRALMEFYELTEEHIPLPEQPNLILSVETDELGIAAGLQDRVVQAYGGLVYMDFSDEYMQRDGYGHYVQLPISQLPPLYLAYTSVPSESGKMHNIVRHRFENGDPEVIDTVRCWAECTDEARRALEIGDHQRLGDLMDLNFDLRLKLYGEDWLGPINLEMIQTARDVGLPAKFAGSGGAVIGCYEDEEQFQRGRRAFESRGYSFGRIVPTTSAEIVTEGALRYAVM